MELHALKAVQMERYLSMDFVFAQLVNLSKIQNVSTIQTVKQVSLGMELNAILSLAYQANRTMEVADAVKPQFMFAQLALIGMVTDVFS